MGGGGARWKRPWRRVVTQTEIESIRDCSLSDEEYKKVLVGYYLQHIYKISPTMEKKAINFSKTPKP